MTVTAGAARDGPAFPVGRHALYLLGFILGIANVGFQQVFEQTALYGWWPALAALFDISALVWAAIAAFCAILVSADSSPNAGARDYLLVGLVVLACLAPVRSAAAIATSLLAINAMLSAAPRAPLFRAAAIALSVVATLYWGRVVLTLSGSLLLDLDVALAGSFSGLRAEGNLLYFASSDPAFAGKGFLIASACSSLHGMSVAFLAVVLVTQFYDLRINRTVLLWGFAGVLATLAVNLARLSAMGHFPEWFEWIHTGPGAAIAGTTSMVLVLLANMGGNWRAIRGDG